LKTSFYNFCFRTPGIIVLIMLHEIAHIR